jgi:hypothetical protein
MRGYFSTLAVLAALLAGGCATLGLGIVAPRFAVADEQPSELRLLGPSLERPLGGASIRLYARVENPNPIGITLSSLTGTLRLEGFEAADANFPLGLPLQPSQVTVVPLDIAVSFADFPGLTDVIGRAVSMGSISYDLRGTARVDAGSLGQPSFGPMTILQGSLQARR